LGGKNGKGKTEGAYYSVGREFTPARRRTRAIKKRSTKKYGPLLVKGKARKQIHVSKSGLSRKGDNPEMELRIGG